MPTAARLAPLALLFALSCGGPSADSTPAPPIPTGGAFLDLHPEAVGDVVIRLERTACFGTCPVYVLSVHGDGRVVFEGSEHTAAPGRHAKQVDPEAVRALVEEFRRVEFWEMADSYRYETNPDGTVSTVTDFPTRITSISLGGVTKRVENYFGGPPELTQLEDRIDATAGVAEWLE